MRGVIPKWTQVHPIIKAIVEVCREAGFRITSIVRPGAPKHARGLAVDVAPMMYDSSWATFEKASKFYDWLSTTVSPDILVVGEDDHIHVEVNKHSGPGYSGRLGRNIPQIDGV